MSNTNFIVLLDDVEEIRELLCTYFQMALPVGCLAYSNLKELQTQSSIALSSRVAILDLELGPGEPSGIQAYEWFVSNNYQGKIFFLTGHGRFNPLVLRAKEQGAEILEKPFPAAQLVSLIEKYIPNESTSNRGNSF